MSLPTKAIFQHWHPLMLSPPWVFGLYIWSQATNATFSFASIPPYRNLLHFWSTSLSTLLESIKTTLQNFCDENSTALIICNFLHKISASLMLLWFSEVILKRNWWQSNLFQLLGESGNPRYLIGSKTVFQQNILNNFTVVLYDKHTWFVIVCL